MAFRANASLSERIVGGTRSFLANAIEKTLGPHAGYLGLAPADVVMRKKGSIVVGGVYYVNLGSLVSSLHGSAMIQEVTALIVQTSAGDALVDNIGGPFSGMIVSPSSPLVAINERGWPMSGLITFSNIGDSQTVYDILLIGRSLGGVPDIEHPPVAISPPSLTGDNLPVGSLTGDVGDWTNVPTSFEIRYLRDDITVLDDAGLTYVKSSLDQGTSIVMGVKAVNAFGVSAEAFSDPFLISGGTGLSQPENVEPPSIEGTAVIGSSLTAIAGVWLGSPDPTFSYSWYDNSFTLLSNAQSYTPLTAGDIYVGVKATNSQGTVTLFAQAFVIDPPPAQTADSTYWKADKSTWRDQFITLNAQISVEAGRRGAF